MAATYNDGTVAYGSRVITINSVAFVADNINVTRPTKAVDRTNELGEPSGSVGIADFVTMTAQLQLADTLVEPENGQTTAALTFDTSIGAETFFVTSVGRAEVKDGETKVNVSFKKKYGA
jgi:hypothetical protein